MKARIRQGTTTISHPIYGQVEWIDTSASGDRIKIRYWSAKHGEHLSEWIDWTFPTKKER
tara:strand:+ start:1074 stop:1253 length:180 start_codon:yes stop_codon:yes gene_type:complete